MGSAGSLEYRALLDWRIAPKGGAQPSGSWTDGAAHVSLTASATAKDALALRGQRAKQQQYYNRSTRDLPRIPQGDTFRMRLPGQKKWTPGTCLGLCGPRSYRVRVREREFIRNRRQLLHTKESQPGDTASEDHPSEGESTDKQVGETPAAPTPAGLERPFLPATSPGQQQPATSPVVCKSEGEGKKGKIQLHL